MSGLQMERDRESYGKKAGLGIEGREGHPASAVNQGSARPASSGAGEGPALLLAPCEHWTLAEQLPSGLGTWCAPGASHLRRQMVADWQAIGWGRVCQKFPRLILLEGTGEPGPPGFPYLTLCSGKVNFSGCACPALDAAVWLVWFRRALSLSTVSPLAWPFLVSLGYFPQKIRKWERKTTLFTLSVVFWTLMPGAAYRGPGV